MKSAWISRHRQQWPVSLSCEVLHVSASGYYEHERRGGKPPSGRLSDDALLVHIKSLHAEVRQEYGWPRMWKELVAHPALPEESKWLPPCTFDFLPL